MYRSSSEARRGPWLGCYGALPCLDLRKGGGLGFDVGRICLMPNGISQEEARLDGGKEVPTVGSEGEGMGRGDAVCGRS